MRIGKDILKCERWVKRVECIAKSYLKLFSQVRFIYTYVHAWILEREEIEQNGNNLREVGHYKDE